jgi:hypothetical protein
LNSIYLVGKDFGGVDRIAPGKPVYYFGIYDNQIFPITTG